MDTKAVAQHKIVAFTLCTTAGLLFQVARSKFSTYHSTAPLAAI